jgi:hypothetical protein
MKKKQTIGTLIFAAIGLGIFIVNPKFIINNNWVMYPYFGIVLLLLINLIKNYASMKFGNKS